MAKEWFRKLRYKLAYLIAPDWIEDLDGRLSGLLCEATHGMLSKSYDTLDAMIGAMRDAQERACDWCEYRREDGE
jgi:hypothetical protein